MFRGVRGTLRDVAIVCSCYAVSERRIQRVIDHGAATIGEIGSACQAGTGCESCHETLDDLLCETRVSVRRFGFRTRLTAAG
jgi:bacterioferritin-associated ferredoxin